MKLFLVAVGIGTIQAAIDFKALGDKFGDLDLGKLDLFDGIGEKNASKSSPYLKEPSKNACDPNPCENGGTCENVKGGAVCICPVGFEGPTCSAERPDPCTIADPCQNGGVCQNVLGEAVCSCPIPFYGVSCELEQTQSPVPVCSEGWVRLPTSVRDDFTQTFRCFKVLFTQGDRNTAITNCENEPTGVMGITADLLEVDAYDQQNNVVSIAFLERGDITRFWVAGTNVPNVFSCSGSLNKIQERLTYIYGSDGRTVPISSDYWEPSGPLNCQSNNFLTFEYTITGGQGEDATLDINFVDTPGSASFAAICQYTIPRSPPYSPPV